jgi:hypothetical protein
MRPGRTWRKARESLAVGSPIDDRLADIPSLEVIIIGLSSFLRLNTPKYALWTHLYVFSVTSEVLVAISSFEPFIFNPST